MTIADRDARTAAVSCREFFSENVLLVNEHPERYCRSTNSVVYALQDRFGET